MTVQPGTPLKGDPHQNRPPADPAETYGASSLRPSGGCCVAD